MKNSSSCALFIALVMCGNVFAQEEGTFLYLKLGEPAPYEGYLLDKMALATIIAKRETDLKQLELRLKYEYEKRDLYKQLEIDNLKLELDSNKMKFDFLLSEKEKEIRDLNTIIDKMPGDYSLLWFLGGVAAGIVVTATIGASTYFLLQP